MCDYNNDNIGSHNIEDDDGDRDGDRDEDEDEDGDENKDDNGNYYDRNSAR